MRTETQARPTDTPTDRNPSRMVHLTEPDDYYRAICGAPLAGHDEPDAAVDCVVCVELAALEDQRGECE